MKRIYGLSVNLPLEIARRLESTPAAAEINISSWNSRAGNISDGTEWYHHWQNSDDGHIWLLAGRRSDCFYVLRFVDENVDFAIAPDGGTIHYQCLTDFESGNVRHLVLTQVLPLVMNLRGTEALHASAVLNSAGAITFVGHSGYGKSTLAASLIQSCSQLISDDVVPIYLRKGQTWTSNGSPDMGLWPRARRLLSLNKKIENPTDKCRMTLPRRLHRTGDFPLSRIYFLSPSEQIAATEITLLSPQESLLELLKATYRLDIRDADMLERQFATLSQVAQLVMSKRITYPAGIPNPAELSESIQQDLCHGSLKSVIPHSFSGNL